MNVRLRRTWALAAGLAVAISAAGIAVSVAADTEPLPWYDASNATVPDANRVGTLKFYNASGASITTGSTTAKPFAAFVEAPAALRAGDTHATLFAYTPQPSLAAGAWSGAQLSGTTTAVADRPGSVSDGLPVVAGAATDGSLADFVAAYPNESQAAAYKNVYEIRLRTSSAGGGVGDTYASAFVEISGTSWTLTDAPVPGDQVSSTTTLTAPAKGTYGKALKLIASVSSDEDPSGEVTFRAGNKVLGTADLSETGQATLTVGRTALKPGKYSVTASYSGSDTVAASTSSARSVTIARAPTTTSPTGPKSVAAGAKAKLTVTVSATGAVPTGQVVVLDGTKQIATGTLSKGKVSIQLPALSRGKHTITVSYPATSLFGASSAKLTITQK